MNRFPLLLGLILLLAVAGATPAVGQSGLASTPWPTFGQDLRRTGRSPNAGPASAQVLWTASAVHSNNRLNDIALGPNGTIYAGAHDQEFNTDDDQHLYAFGPDGSLKWTYNTLENHSSDEQGDVSAAPTVRSDGVLYVSSNSDHLHAVNPDSTRRWATRLHSQHGMPSSPAIADDSTVYVGTNNLELDALDRKGNVLWTMATDGRPGSPAIAQDGTIYLASGNSTGQLTAFSSQGNKQWSYGLGGRAGDAPTVGPNGTIYVGSGTGKLHAVRSDGTRRWTFDTGGEVRNTPAIGPNGTIYVGSRDNSLYALNQDGTLKWTYQTAGDVGAPVVGGDGRVYVGSRDSTLYALQSDGSLAWTVEVDAPITEMPVINSTGRIYVPAGIKVYAIGTSKPPPPTRLTASVAPDNISLQWQTSGTADGLRYRLYRDTAPIDSSAGPASYTALDSTTAGDTTVVDTTVTTGTTYYYRVTAVDSSGNESGFSEEVAATVGTSNTIYVDGDATGAQTGATWSDAYTRLQDALDEARYDSTTFHEVWVAAGTYYPDQDAVDQDGDGQEEHTPGNRSESFSVSHDNVALYGGFSGAETSRDQRDPSTNEVVLSGDIGVASDTSDNSYHVVYLDGADGGDITNSTVIDGVTVERGNARGSGLNDAGGGLFCDAGGSGSTCAPIIRNVTFRENGAVFGGAVFNNGTDAALQKSSQKTAGVGDRRHGRRLMSLEGADPKRTETHRKRSSVAGASPRLVNVTFARNNADGSGGAMYNWGDRGTASPVLVQSTFRNNVAGSWGGALMNDASPGTSSPNMQDITFRSNEATTGGAILTFAGIGGVIRSTITSSIFVNNQAEYGGAVQIFSDSTDAGGSPSEVTSRMSGVTFRQNAATGATDDSGAPASDGGAVRVWAIDDAIAEPTLVNSAFAGNSATRDGGAVQTVGAVDVSGGVADPVLTNVTMAGNTADKNGGALHNYGGSSGSAAPRLTNVVLWGNQGDADGDGVGSDNEIMSVNSSAQPSIAYSLVEGDTSAVVDVNGASTTYDLSSNLAQNPQFAAVNEGAGSDGVYGTGDDDFRLQGPDSPNGASPAIDAGDNTALDLNGDGTQDVTEDRTGLNRRIDVADVADTGNGTAPLVDIGAHESDGSALRAGASPVITTIRPQHGAPGTPVRIRGSGYDPAPSNNTVTFGGASATVDSAKSSVLYASVPSGISGPVEVSVSVGSGSAAAPDDFVAVAGGGNIFSSTNAGLAAVHTGTIDWGDYDGDGDQDLVLTGSVSSATPTTKIYRNDGGSFTEISAGLTPVMKGGARWGDFDSDGDLDLIVTGNAGMGTAVTKLYRNDGGGTFTAVGAGFPGLFDAAAAWGDYNGDGRLDLVLTGDGTDGNPVTTIFRNDGGGTFSPVGAGLEGVWNGSVAWADYDGDGDLDLFVTGTQSEQGSGTELRVAGSALYENQGGGSFSSIGAGIDGVEYGSAAWRDYDGDGDPDLLLSGTNNYIGFTTTKLYENVGGSFREVHAGLQNVSKSSATWGDFNGDGAPDVVVTGSDSATGDPVALLYRNDGGSFSVVDRNIGAVKRSTAAWSDVNGDGHLDLVTAGVDSTGSRSTTLYRSDRFSRPDPITVDIRQAFGDATQQENYELVALPGSPDTAIDATLSGSSPDDWRAFRETGSTTSNGSDLEEFDGSDAFDFGPGRGFWVLSRDSWAVNRDIPTVSLSSSFVRSVDLHPGWNVVSNPFGVDVSWSRVQQENGMSAGLWSWSGGWSEVQTFQSAQDGRAFYVRNRANLDSLRIPYPVNKAGTAAPGSADPARQLRLSVLDENERGSTVRMGVSPQSAPGIDPLDRYAPPRRFQQTSLHVHAGSTAAPLAADIRRAGSASGHQYDLDLISPAGEPVTFQADQLSAFSDEEVVLVSEGSGAQYDLHREPQVTVTPKSEASSWTVLVGDEAFVSEQTENLVPPSVELRQNRPNPVRNETTITYAVPEARRVRLSIFDVLGRRVARLVDGTQSAGVHSVRWSGERVGSGVYFYRLTVGETTKTRKMVVIQ